MFPTVHRYLLIPAALTFLPLAVLAGEVSLSGQASVKYTPDSVRLQFTANAEHNLPEQATRQVNQQMEQWRERISDFRDQLDAYSDASVNLYSRSIPSRERDQQPEKMAVASQTVSFTIDDLSLLNPILEQAQALGMDYNLGPHQFFHSNESSLRKQALAGAIADARARCEFVANELDKQCGEVINISINDGHQPPVPMMAEMRASSAPVSSVGPRELQAQVSATFELE
ncbi:SIMPL domain-containing protein [Marinobacter sp. TBZ242]|uniref:SIMPL domain-containing protein n=1 Tax=Marinobacter azerbaijanicus TaxID=3050455 RepID=A0ABT7I8R3_9GAMM|nr:SIMPL domain-containing protein [Marinobacter sp. TBZ242]MDL0430095.1 SIMPL domain-containing protein [Marinobacter sp. TBZ242]